MPISVGIDLVSVETILASIARDGDRYLDRVYTPGELADCSTGAAVNPKQLAARFAAKEATIKVLRPDRDEAVPWRDIEVRRDPAGVVGLTLHKRAATLAERSGVVGLSVSLTFEREFASAFVIAEMRRMVDIHTQMNDKIRQVIRDHARLPVDVGTLSDDADLFQAGMTSHASVNVMLALEDAFEIEFPDRMLRRDVFESVGAIGAALTELQNEVVR
jgi:phosphopantetheine--protein transferase-like protein